MKAAEMLVFDGQLTSAVNVSFTSDELHDVLGSFDQISVKAVVCGVRALPLGSITVRFQHSADGRSWLNKVGTGVVPPSGVLPVNASVQQEYYGFDSGATPSLALVRLQIDLTDIYSALVRVFVIGRNIGEPEERNAQGTNKRRR